jgi:hypothetical protein
MNDLTQAVQSAPQQIAYWLQLAIVVLALVLVGFRAIRAHRVNRAEQKREERLANYSRALQQRSVFYGKRAA